MPGAKHSCVASLTLCLRALAGTHKEKLGKMAKKAVAGGGRSMAMMLEPQTGSLTVPGFLGCICYNTR